MKYLIAILLPSEISQAITTLQQRYKTDRWKIRVAPHITLVFRGDLIGSQQTLIDILKDTAQYHDPFDIDIQGIDTFDHHLKVVYAAVKVSPALLQLQQDLVKTIQRHFIADDNYSHETVYRPHVTIANRLTHDEAASAIAQLAMAQIDYSFQCQTFTLFRRSRRDEFWQEVVTIQLDQ